MPRTIVVIGGISRRIIAEVDQMPETGLTVIPSTYESHTGGRGAFSAVTAYRLSHFKPPSDEESPGCVLKDDEISIRLVGAIGNDDIGQPMKDRIRNVGVNTDRVQPILDTQTGTVFVLVQEDSKQPGVLLCPGANHALQPNDFESAEKLLEQCGDTKPDLLITNCELQRRTVEQILKVAVDAEVPVLLNLVPEEAFFPEDLKHLTHLIVHEAEARRVFDKCPQDDDDPHDWEDFAQQFLSRGVANVVVTLGSHGAYFSNQDGSKGHVPSREHNVDKVGGG